MASSDMKAPNPATVILGGAAYYSAKNFTISDMSDYRYLLLIAGCSVGHILTTIIPYDSFKAFVLNNGQRTWGFAYQSSTYNASVVMKYVSDTQVYVEFPTIAGWTDPYFEVYGIPA